jgi:FkbM family methyltransferase
MDLFRRFRIGKVFDIGANVGDKTEIFIAAGAKQVLLVEPDPHWRRIHEWRFGGDARVFVRPAAVTDESGSVALNRFGPGSPLNTLEKKWVDALETGAGRFDPREIDDIATVEAVTYDQLVSEYGEPDYTKVDVEGHEAVVLSGMTQWPRLLSLEFNLPEFATEMAACVKMATRNNPECRFNFVVDCGEGFASPEWMTAFRLSEILTACPIRYLELYVDSGG